MTDLPPVPVGTQAANDDFDPGRQALLPPGFEPSFENLPTFFTGTVTGGNNPSAQGSTGQQGGTLGGTSPRYFENDQAYIWTGSQAVAPSQMSPETIAQYQRRFQVAGLLGEGSYTPGVWDTASVAANRELLRIANVNGTSAVNALAAMQNAGSAARRRLSGGGGGGGGGRIAPTIRLSNPDDLRSVFRQVARQTTGGVFVEDDQINGMVEAYQQREREYQVALQGGGTVESAPSAQTFAETSLEELDEGGAQANRFAQMTAVLGQMVG